MSHSYTTNQIRLNIPAKVMPVTVSTIEGVEYWPFPNSSSDPWYSQSATPRHYRWRITFSVTSVSHGSNLTRDDFAFNGLDIRVNDWIAGASDPKTLKIVSIEAKTPTSVTCIVEDWLRYNTFKASTGNGIFNTGSAVVFTLNENGIPVLDPLPSTVNNQFFPGVVSRFQYLNPQVNYVLEQKSHSFVKGDAVSVTSDGFVKSNASTAVSLVGVVTEPGPGDNYFMILPNNKIIDFDPAIPGVQGDSIYVDTDGTLSSASTSTNKIIFLNIQSPVATEQLGNVNDPVVPAGTSIEINGAGLTFSANTNLSDTIDLINTQTANSDVVASSSPTPTIVVSNSVGTANGLVGGTPPFSATINGTLVSFTTTGSQYAGISTPEDMAIDINSASINNLVATATATVLTLTQTQGVGITIVNGDPDASGNPFVGSSNISGLVATTAPTGTARLKLSRSNGGEVLILDSTLGFQNSTGVYSGQNGSLPLALNVEQGIRTGGVTVVADISARDTLAGLVGDQAYVLDAGLGEWALFLYNGSAWTLIATEDSSTVDARTLTTTFTAPFSGNVDVQSMGSVSAGRKITTVSVEVSDTFAGGSNTPSIEIGTSGTQNLFMGDSDSDLSQLEEYVVLPEYVHPSSSGTELTIQARLNHFDATQGVVTVKVTYL